MINNGVSSKHIEEITLDEAVEEIEMLRVKDGITDFIITQNVKGITKTFEVHDFEIANEEEVVVCSDENKTLMKRNCIICAFVKACVTKVKKVFNKDKTTGEMVFSNGDTVTLEAINQQ
jgi:hypothetical protein